MGNAVDCFKKNKQPPKQSLIIPKIILTAPSVPQIESASTSSVLSLNQNVPNNFQSEFNYSKIQTIYLGFSTSLDSNDLELTIPMVYAIEEVFDVLEKDLTSTAKKIHFCTSFLGKTFKEKFIKCASLSDNIFKKYGGEERMLAHAISYVKFHKMLVYLFKRDVREAKKCLNLLAFSHMNMKINQTDFRMFDVAVEKFLLKFNITNEANLKIAVSYFNLITNYICYYIKVKGDNSHINEMISQQDTSSERENVREMRRWNNLIGRLRYETCPYIEEVIDDKKGEIGREKNELCPLSNIECMFSDKRI